MPSSRLTGRCSKCGRTVDVRSNAHATFDMTGRVRQILLCSDPVRCAKPWAWWERFYYAPLGALFVRGELPADPRKRAT